MIGFITYTQSWSGVALPIVKKMFAKISAKDFVSVQPMQAPAGAVFYMDYVYGFVVIIFDEELWWEDDGKGGWYCPELQVYDKISDKDWIKQRDEYLIIPKWEVEQQEKFVDGLRNDQVKPFGYVPLKDEWLNDGSKTKIM